VFASSPGDLQEVVRRSCQIVLPPEVYNSIKAIIDQRSDEVPDQFQLSRARLVVDVSLMLYRRCLNYKALVDKVHYAHYLYWDSSPQFGRDYENSLVRSIRQLDLRELFQIYRELRSLWEGDDIAFPLDMELQETKDKIDREKKLMDRGKSLMHLHALPACLVGFGNSDFASKTTVLFHEGRLEHFTHASFAAWWIDFVTSMADYGVEKMLPRLKEIYVHQVCPHFQDTHREDIAILMKMFSGSRRADPGDERSHEEESDAAGRQGRADDEVLEDIPGEVSDDELIGPPGDEVMEDFPADDGLNDRPHVPPQHDDQVFRTYTALLAPPSTKKTKYLQQTLGF